MHNALRMHQHLYLVGGHVKEPFGLNHLEAFVHHRSRVDGNLCTHLPGGMLQGIGSRYGAHLVERKLAEGATRCGEQYLLNFVIALAHNALEDGRVLAINGQDGHMVFGRQLAYQFASHHQRLLVGQTNFLACLDGVYGGVQA